MHSNAQSGNVFVIILVGIALFAALGYTISRGFRSETTNNLTKRQADLAAGEILDYAQKVGRTVDRLRARGCSESEISFENPMQSGFDYVTRDACKVFGESGGQITFRPVDVKWMDSSFSAKPNYMQWAFNGGVPVENLGSTKPELIMRLNYLQDAICTKINDSVGVTNPSGSPPVVTNGTPTGGNPFLGEFGDPIADTEGDVAAEIAGKSSFCRESSSVTGNNQLNYVLIER